MSEKAYEKHAWILLFAVGIFGLVSAFNFLVSRAPLDPQLLKNLTGMTWDELVTMSSALASLVRLNYGMVGINVVIQSIFGMGVAAIPYKRGERWAWYISWMWLVLLIGGVANSLPIGEIRYDLLPLFIATILGLFLPYRKFFPKKQS